MRSLPEDFEPSALIGCLADGWGFEVEAADYAPVGAGSYHWVVSDRSGERGFVTVDDLDRKPWLGDTRESAFDGLQRAFDTAVGLRDAGLGFVVAPIPTRCGKTLRRIGPRYSIALFPFVDGQPGRPGQYEAADERAAVVRMLAELHAATPAVGHLARRMDLELPGRGPLESGLQELHQPWLAGPFAEPARQALASHAAEVAILLARFDRLAAEVARRSTHWVITHGEPHFRNVLRTSTGHLLVDWDTVALGPPERDLWMVLDDAGCQAPGYADATGHPVDQVTATFFGLMWDLADVAAYLNVLQVPHGNTEDTRTAYDRLLTCLAKGDRWAALLG